MLCNGCYQKIKKIVENNPTFIRKKKLYERIEGFLKNDKKTESIEQIVSEVFEGIRYKFFFKFL